MRFVTRSFGHLLTSLIFFTGSPVIAKTVTEEKRPCFLPNKNPEPLFKQAAPLQEKRGTPRLMKPCVAVDTHSLLCPGIRLGIETAFMLKLSYPIELFDSEIK